MGILYKHWKRMHLTDANMDVMEKQFKKDEPLVGGYDTETTGLHIRKDKPFLIVFGWFKRGSDSGRVFTFEPTDRSMSIFFRLAKKLKAFIGQNVKFDLHMTANIGWEYLHDNLVENMALARLSVEAIPAREGGDSLSLTDLGAKYVDPRANRSEKIIRELRARIRSDRTKVLAAALRQFPLVINGITQVTATGRVRHWGVGAVEDFIKDITNTMDDLPPEVREVWEEWQGEEVTYEDIYKQYPSEMIAYAQEDVITMLLYAKKAYKTVAARKQMHVLRHENNAILPLYRMERVGLRVDRDYLKESQVRVRNYILEKRRELVELAGEEVTCNQHKRIGEIFFEKWNIEMESTDQAALKHITKDHEGGPKRFAELVSMLRTLEKWYSTYILRYLKLSEYDGRFYTQISQCSAVSGRVGSDSQQMPRSALVSEEGEELFHTRKAFIPTDRGKSEGYNSIWYCDLSQVELRVAANYTLMVSEGDLNLCRAYMPFKCYHKDNGKEFDYKDPDVRRQWNSGEWLDENGNPWTPTDVHDETTIKAYGVGHEHPDFEDVLRERGKATNFLCLYGGGAGALASSLDIDIGEARQLHQGYKDAFPMLDVYSRVVEDQYRKNGYVPNMYGRRYYLKNPNDAYKLANYLIQGSCADDMKRIIIEVDELLKGYKSRMILTIHDEIQIELWKGEEHLIPKVLAIMGDIEWSMVPIIADAEVTYTNWSEAKGVD